MRRVFLIPNIITAFGLSCGLFVIFRVIFPFEASLYSMIYTSAWLLLFAAFADLLDGALARIFRAESEFGILFDSMSDAICFGIAPSVLFLASIDLKTNTLLGFFAIGASMIYSMCTVLRLVRFMIIKSEAKGDKQAELLCKTTFVGLPTPGAAAVAVAMNLFFSWPLAQDFVPVSMQTKIIIMICTLVLLGYLMISRWKFPAVKSIRVRIHSIYLVFLTAVLAVFILFGILYFMPLLFLLLSLAYVFSGIALSTIRKFTSKESKTLQEFDTDHDEDDL